MACKSHLNGIDAPLSDGVFIFLSFIDKRQCNTIGDEKFPRQRFFRR